MSRRQTLCCSVARLPTSPLRRALGSTPFGNEKAEFQWYPVGRLSGNDNVRRSRRFEEPVGSPLGGPHTLYWLDPPRRVFIVKKPNDSYALQAAKDVIGYFRERHPEVSVLVEQPVAEELNEPDVEAVPPGSSADLGKHVDFTICLGGDGTALHYSSLCSSGAVPPFVGLSLGTLGFLMPHCALESSDETIGEIPAAIANFEKTLDGVFASLAFLILRMRLQCSLHADDGRALDSVNGFGSQALNEIYLHRGRHPHMAAIEVYVNDQLLTEAVADGLIVATPTGSTAYSLSAGGPIVHPSVQSLVLTPISPRSLSFRPVLLPPDVCIQLKISSSSRSPAEISLDGREVRLVHPGQSVRISMSPYPVPCLVPLPRVLSDDEPPLLSDGWISDIQTMLAFNKTFARRDLPDEALYDKTV